MQDLNAPPLNPLPPVVWLLVLPVVAMEVVVQIGASGLAGGQAGMGWRQDAAQRFAFAPDYLRAMWEQGYWPLAGLARLVSYPLIHADIMHTVFVVVFLLALGKFVGEIFRPWAFLVIAFGAMIGAAVLYTLVGMTSPLFGGYPPAYGLIGAFTYIRWLGLDGAGSRGAQAFTLIGMMLGIQLLFGALFGANPVWVAELAGFVIGFLLSFVVSPGGADRLVAMLRQR